MSLQHVLQPVLQPVLQTMHSPLDFTFVCPTEITAFSDRIKEFEAIGCNVSAPCRTGFARQFCRTSQALNMIQHQQAETACVYKTVRQLGRGRM
jgi:hypothetical protein